MPTPSFVPEAPSGFLGNSKKDNFSLKLWFVIAWTGFLFLPWYGAYDGFWSFIWVTDGYPTFDEYSPGILQITLHQRWWLCPVALSLLIPLPSLIWPRTDPRHAIILLFGGGFGFVYTLTQGFILGCMVGIGSFLITSLAPQNRHKLAWAMELCLFVVDFYFYSLKVLQQEEPSKVMCSSVEP